MGEEDGGQGPQGGPRDPQEHPRHAEGRHQLIARLCTFLWRVELALVTVAVVACAIMMLLTSADALCRYLLNWPILGAYEITEKYLMVATIFLGLSYAYRGGVFIRVTLLVDRLPPPLRRLADQLAHILTLVYCLLFVVASGQQAWLALDDDTTLTTLPILVGPAYLLVPIGFLALMVMLLIDLPRVRKGDARLFAQDAPAS
jgi:TRAP-type C4-dicarboxylate transport system permease small subunit